MKTTRYRFQTAIESVNEDTTSWLKDEFKTILESEKDFTRKCDYIGFSIANIDSKVASLDEEIKELQSLKKKLKEAKDIALTIGAEVFNEYGIDKIEGAGISSITITKSTSKQSHHLEILDEEVLIDAGFYKKVLDEDAVLQAYEAQDPLALKYCSLSVEEIQTPAKLRINKRKGVNNSIEPNELEAAS